MNNTIQSCELALHLKHKEEAKEFETKAMNLILESVNKPASECIPVTQKSETIQVCSRCKSVCAPDALVNNICIFCEPELCEPALRNCRECDKEFYDDEMKKDGDDLYCHKCFGELEPYEAQPSPYVRHFIF